MPSLYVHISHIHLGDPSKEEFFVMFSLYFKTKNKGLFPLSCHCVLLLLKIKKDSF